jgi:hypothetical protein
MQSGYCKKRLKFQEMSKTNHPGLYSLLRSIYAEPVMSILNYVEKYTQ